MWDIFGEDSTPPVAPIVPPAKRSRNALVDAVAPFLAADGTHIVVPPPPARAGPAGDEAKPAWADFHPPRVYGPIQVRTFDDCGRGFTAARDIMPGELLMAEEPFMAWPTAERGPLPLLRAALARSDRDKTLEALGRLHPEDLDSVPRTMRTRLASEHRGTIDSLLGAMRCTVDDESAARDALLRLCLVVQWNAFDNGLFLHQAIFNHASARDANADKAALRDSAGKVLSVVRATRPISRGEQCLISYVQPVELSLAATTHRLRQFDFGCASVHRHPNWDRSPSSAAGASVEDADEVVRSLEAEAERRIHTSMRQLSDVAAAEAAIDELVDQLGAQHLSVACARRQLLGFLRRRLESGHGARDGHPGATTEQLLVALLRNALELWYTQRALLGALHPECATTLHDIGTSIGQLLVHAPRTLCEYLPESWGTPALASHGERRALELHEQIAALYNNDVLSPLNVLL
jgi:hypothetical protein